MPECREEPGPHRRLFTAIARSVVLRDKRRTRENPTAEAFRQAEA